MATGIVNAGGSFGQFIMAPVAAGLTAALGWMTSMQVLGLIVLLALPAAWVLRGNSRQLQRPRHPQVSQAARARARRHPLRSPAHLLIRATGCSPAVFFVCGFHVVSSQRTCRMWWRCAAAAFGERVVA